MEYTNLKGIIKLGRRNLKSDIYEYPLFVHCSFLSACYSVICCTLFFVSLSLCLLVCKCMCVSSLS